MLQTLHHTILRSLSYYVVHHFIPCYWLFSLLDIQLLYRDLQYNNQSHRGFQLPQEPPPPIGGLASPRPMASPAAVSPS